MPQHRAWSVLKSALSIILLSSVAFADCDVAAALFSLRPKAEWNLKGDAYEGITWLDTVQAKPTQKEVTNAITACRQAATAEDAVKVQAKTDLNTTTKTDAERIDAIIKYLGLDK